jgi:hypothetical protein
MTITSLVVWIPGMSLLVNIDLLIARYLEIDLVRAFTSNEFSLTASMRFGFCPRNVSLFRPLCLLKDGKTSIGDGVLPE